MIIEYEYCGTVHDILHDMGRSKYQDILYEPNPRMMLQCALGNKDPYVQYSCKLSWMLQCAKVGFQLI